MARRPPRDAYYAAGDNYPSNRPLRSMPPSQNDQSGVILVTAGYDHTIRFWEALSGICSRTIQHSDSVPPSPPTVECHGLLCVCSWLHYVDMLICSKSTVLPFHPINISLPRQEINMSVSMTVFRRIRIPSSRSMDILPMSRG